jgi:hypothetical protein
MEKSGRYALVLVVFVMVTLLTGCLKSGPGAVKTYKLTVTVLDETTKTPLVGARVEIVGKGSVAKVTNANGQVSFSGLSGTRELLVSSVGYANRTQFVMMERAQSIIIYLATAAGAAVVGDERALAEALGDSTTTSITLTKDLVLSTKLSFDRPVLLNLNGKTLTGDVEYAFETEGELELTGSGVINGDLSINAPYASVTNHLHVTGTVTITDVAGETWNEYGHDNHLVVAGSNLRVNLYNDAQSITITEGAWGIRVNIYQGIVGDFVANSSVEVTGADKISRALVQAEGVVFDLSPQNVTGTHEPTINGPFVPGSGGTIPAFTRSVPPPNTFGGLYVQRNHRWQSFGSSTYPEVDMYFPTPASLGGDGYLLQFFDTADSTWKLYEDAETSSAGSDNFSLPLWATTKFRLLMRGGPLDGYTSNEIEVMPSSIGTYFAEWSMMGVYPYVGETFTGNATAKRLSDGSSVDTGSLTYQWYRVDPVTFTMEAIPGATSCQYTANDLDVGSALLFRATGDEEEIGGFAQVWAANAQPILIPNKAFISDVTANGFTLNLHKKVPGLEKDQLELWAYGPSAPSEPLAIQSVEFVPGSKAKLRVEVEIPTGLESLWLTAKTDYWGIVRNYLGEGSPYIQGEIQYQF